MFKRKSPVNVETAPLIMLGFSGNEMDCLLPATPSSAADDKNNVVDFAALRFSDDYAEYLARADSGGSNYGLLKRHAYAQSSLRVQPTGYSSPTDGLPTVIPTLNCSRQRRSRSLVPPQQPSSGCDSNGSPGSVPDQKSIIKALCEQTQKKQKVTSTHQELQVNPSTIEYRRHSATPCFDYRKSGLHPCDISDRTSSASVLSAVTWNHTRAPLTKNTLGGGGSPLPSAVHGDAAAATLLRSCVNCVLMPTQGVVPLYRRRSFSVTPSGGLINEGDMVVPFATGPTSTADDRSLLLSAVAVPTGATVSGVELSRRNSYNSTDSTEAMTVESPTSSGVCRVLMLGGPGVGKTALTQQFLTSEFMAAQNTSFDDGREIIVPVLLDRQTSFMEFIDLPYSGNLEVWREYDVDCFIIIYSITDRRSYQKASDIMASMCGDSFEASGSEYRSRSSKPVILVANKSDLERSRMIGKEEGKTLAHDHNCKYIEVSAILNHKVDDLLVGALKQIRLHHQRKHQLQQQQRQQQQRCDHHRSCGRSDNIICTQYSVAASLRALATGCVAPEQQHHPAAGCLLTATAADGVLSRLLCVGSGRPSRTRTSKSCENLLGL